MVKTLHTVRGDFDVIPFLKDAVTRFAVGTEFSFMRVRMTVGTLTKGERGKSRDRLFSGVGAVAARTSHRPMQALKRVVRCIVIKRHGLCEALPRLDAGRVAVFALEPFITRELMLVNVLMAVIAAGGGS